MIAPPTVAFVTATIDTITCSLVPPTDPTYDHSVALVYDFITGAIVHTEDPAADPTFTIVGLAQNRTYVIVCYAVDTGGDFSAPAVNLIVAVTNYEAPSPPVPDLEITNIYQVGLGEATRVVIEYSLKKASPPLTGFNGELVKFDYSFNGSFTDAEQMTPDFDHPLMSGLVDLEFLPEALILPPQHRFVWDINKDLPPGIIHEYAVKLQGRLKGVNTLERTDTIDIDRTTLKEVIGAVTVGGTLNYGIFIWNDGAPFTGATITVQQILDPDQVDQLGGAVVLTENPLAPGLYEGSFVVTPGQTTGLWQIVYDGKLAGPPNLTVSDVEHFFVLASGALSTASLSDPTLCLVYGTLVDIEGNPIAGKSVKAVYKREPSRYDRVGTITRQVETDDNGFFAIPLLREVDAVLMIPDLEYSELLKVPDATAAEFRSIQVNQPSVLTRGPFGHTKVQN